MKRPWNKVLVLVIAVVLFFSWKLLRMYMPNGDIQPPTPPETSSPEATPPGSFSDENSSRSSGKDSSDTLNVEEYAVAKLLEHGWNVDAAKAVFQLNKEFFERIAELNIHDLDDELSRLYRLNEPEIQAKLVSNPEYATLLCSVMTVSSNGASEIIRTLPLDEDEQTFVAYLYQLNAVPEDAVEMAHLLQNQHWQEVIIALIRKSPQNIEMLHYFQLVQQLQKEAPQAADVYERWLLDILGEYLSIDPDSDRTAELTTFLTVYSDAIIRELKHDINFCKAFPACWNTFEYLLNSLDRSDENFELQWSCYCQEPDIFRFLYEYRDEQAEKLYQKYGVAGTEILLSSTFCSPSPEARTARDKLIQLMLTSDPMLNQAIILAQPHKSLDIIQLLNRGLPDDYYRNMFLQMAEANQGQEGGATANLASKWNRLSINALKKELGMYNPGFKQFIPGYDVYCLCEKSLQGRDVSGWDLAFAGIDAAFLVVDVVTIGSGTAVTSTISTASKSGGKTVIKGAAKGGVKLTAKEIRKNSTLTLNVLKQSNKLVSKEITQSTQGIDISKFVKFAFKKSGVGNETFKKWTGMDARIFMRKDRKVLLHLDKIPATRSGKLARNILCDTAIGCGFDTVLQTDTGQKIVRSGKNIASDTNDTALEWKKNLSMWWRLNQND